MTTALLQDKSGDDQENLEIFFKKLDELFQNGLRQLNAVLKDFLISASLLR